MKSVLISIRPKWCEKIASGEKTIEVLQDAPKAGAAVPGLYLLYPARHSRILPRNPLQ